MKSVLISIQPKWCELIASGKKTVEVRKTKPKLETPFKCYIYETKAPKLKYVWTKKDYEGYPWFKDMDENEKVFHKIPQGRGKVIGEFVCDKTYDVIQFGMGIAFGDNGRIIEPQEMLNKACLAETELEKYFESSGGYAWHISDLVIYDKPKELSGFVTICVNDGLNPYKCDKCEYYYTESYEIGVYEECCCNNLKPLKRPPQSWCYVAEQ